MCKFCISAEHGPESGRPQDFNWMPVELGIADQQLPGEGQE